MLKTKTPRGIRWGEWTIQSKITLAWDPERPSEWRTAYALQGHTQNVTLEDAMEILHLGYRPRYPLSAHVHDDRDVETFRLLNNKTGKFIIIGTLEQPA